MSRLTVLSLASFFLTCSTGSVAENQAKPGEVTISPSASGYQATPSPGDEQHAAKALTPLTEKDLDAVRERAMAYLDLIKINDIASAYRMEYGSADGSLSPLRFNQIRPGGFLLDYGIKEVQIQDGEAVVKCNVRVILPEMRTPYDTTWEMRWVMQEGTLYHKSRQPDEAANLGQMLN